MAASARILYCHCAYARIVPAETKTEVLTRLASSSAEWDSVPDLCEMSARRHPGLAQIASGGEATIVACYPRAVRWLFDAAGTTLPDSVRVLNMRVATAPEICSALQLPGEAQ